MPDAGDSFTITLNTSHLRWGTFRYTNTRNRIYGEGYIPIPRRFARAFGIFNSNNHDANIRYNCTSTDGFYNGVLLAQGCSQAHDIYAKQFAEEGNLKGIGAWYAHVNARVGSHIRVTWTSPYDIVIEHF